MSTTFQLLVINAYFYCQLKNQGLAPDSLHILYQSIIQSKIIYALPAFAGQLTAMDITHFDALARKAKRRGFAKTISSMLEITEYHDESFFKRMRDPSHICLHHLLPPVRPKTRKRKIIQHSNLGPRGEVTHIRSNWGTILRVKRSRSLGRKEGETHITSANLPA